MKRSRKEEEEDGGFKCKTCNKMFHSFQALGGHRASHNKLKQVIPDNKPKPKMHLCPICGLEFAIGQALGGHMRKHRVRVAPNDDGFNLTVHHHAAASKSNVPKRLRLWQLDALRERSQPQLELTDTCFK